MSDHAPAPWKVQPYVDGIDILDANHEVVATLADRWFGSTGTPPENARIIAASPELLAACEAGLAWFKSESALEEINPVIRGFKAAISKAKGEQP